MHGKVKPLTVALTYGLIRNTECLSMSYRDNIVNISNRV